ncbi:MAG: hypothetical protein ABSC21_19505 [Terriglobia bacterium]
MSRALKCEVGVFAVVWFALMLYGDKQVYATLWTQDNVFLRCLGTVVETAIGSAGLTGLLWGVYWAFQQIAGRWGRLFVIPWIGISVWLFPYILDRNWPHTNPDPVGTAALFAVLGAAGILLLAIGLCFRGWRR